VSSPPIALAHLLNHAADMVQGVLGGRSLTELLGGVPSAARPGTQALAFEALRRLGGAQAVRAIVAPKAPPREVEALLVTALALLWPPAPGERALYPDHTLVDQAVHAARRRVGAAASFINAVLRRFVRERAELVDAAQRQPVGAFNHPLWWVERLKRDWPTQWQALLVEANRHPPMALRVNARRTTAEAYVQQLAAQGLAAQAVGTHAVVLAEPRPVTALPGFAEGEVSVQDLAAQRAAPLLLGEGDARLSAGARVLDACAAPGGKACHVAEIEPRLAELVALDVDAARAERIKANLARLGLAARVVVADAADPAAWWDGRPFERILLDVPCSGSGVIRRHPDIKLLRRPADIARFAAQQSTLLRACWNLLAPGGRLVYASCSVFAAENSAVVGAFLAAGERAVDVTESARLSLPGALPWQVAGPGCALASGAADADGFYYACLEKRA
jgi:16S rRNA (cytosine967-C5)-methyltransferase